MENLFTKSTTLISIILAIIAGTGILIKPDNSGFIITIVLIAIAVIISWEKFNQIEINKRDINELNKRLNIEARFNNIEIRLSKMEKK